MKKIVHHNDGYSLIEVMIALVIFAIITVGTASMIMASMRANRQAAETTSAYYATQRYIDALQFQVSQSANYADSLVIKTQAATDVDGFDVHLPPPGSLVDIYTVRIRVFDADTDPQINARIKAIRATAVWVSYGGTRKLTTNSMLEVPQ